MSFRALVDQRFDALEQREAILKARIKHARSLDWKLETQMYMAGIHRDKKEVARLKGVARDLKALHKALAREVKENDRQWNRTVTYHHIERLSAPYRQTLARNFWPTNPVQVARVKYMFSPTVGIAPISAKVLPPNFHLPLARFAPFAAIALVAATMLTNSITVPYGDAAAAFGPTMSANVKNAQARAETPSGDNVLVIRPIDMSKAAIAESNKAKELKAARDAANKEIVRQYQVQLAEAARAKADALARAATVKAAMPMVIAPQIQQVTADNEADVTPAREVAPKPIVTKKMPAPRYSQRHNNYRVTINGRHHPSAPDLANVLTSATHDFTAALHKTAVAMGFVPADPIAKPVRSAFAKMSHYYSAPAAAVS